MSRWPQATGPQLSSLTQDAAAGGKKNKGKKYHSRLSYLAHRDTLRYTSNGVMGQRARTKPAWSTTILPWWTHNDYGRFQWSSQLATPCHAISR